MTTFLPFIIAGIVSGSIYGLAATGLVLSYKTSGIFNFGQGALATIGAYVFYALTTNGFGWVPAAAITCLLVAPGLGLVLEVIARALTPQRTVWKIVGTIGIISLVQGLGSITYGQTTLPVAQFLPGSTDSIHLLGVAVQYSQLGTIAVAIFLVGVLQLLFRRTRFGVAMRAVVENPDLADIQGTDPIRVRRMSWIISSVLATLSGILLLPLIGLDPVLFTYLFLSTYAAAAIGLFSSIPLTFVGGIVVGIISSLLSKVEFAHSSLTGISSASPFVVLVIVMLVSPRKKLLPLNAVQKRPRLEWRAPGRLRFGTFVIVCAFLAAVPLWASGHTLVPYWAAGLVSILWFLSLGLLVHNAGLSSLCTLTFAAIGAVGSAHLISDAHVPWLLSVLLAGLIAVPVGTLVSLPGVRLSGTFLGLSTLGFALVVQYLFYPKSWMFGKLDVGLAAPRPHWARGDISYYYLLLGFVAVGVVFVIAINRARLGRMLSGMNEAPRVVSTLGLNVNVARVLVFSISAFIAAVAGALYSPIFGFATPAQFAPFQSLVLIATLCVLPFGAPWYAVFGGITQVIPGYIPGTDTVYVMNAIFGLSAILTATQGGAPRMPDRWRAIIDERFARRHRRARSTEVEHPRLDVRRPQEGLIVDDLTVRFGGLTAVSDMSLRARMGHVTALIGPNGAGKTTIFNSCSGLVRASSGTITIGGKNLQGMAPHVRAQHGLGRTFQVMELCESLSVTENVALGREARQAGGKLWTQLMASVSDVRARDRAVSEAIELCELGDIVERQAGALSTGQRRRVEFARALAGDFDILLLDEPSSGLGPDETRQFGEVLRRVVRERECGILLVEHDVSLVMGVSDYVYVVDFGKKIFEGEPAEVRNSEVVKSAYLGGGTETASQTFEAEATSGRVRS